MVCSTIYSLSTPPHRHVREHGDVSHLEGMPREGGYVTFCHVYIFLAISQRQVQRVSIHMRRFRLSWSGSFLGFLDRCHFFHSWSCSKCWRPILPEITFSRSVRSLLDNVALVLLSRSYRFSGSKDPPLLGSRISSSKVLSFFGSKDPSLLEVVLLLPKVSLFSWK